LDTSTPAGRAMFQMLGVFSEFERAMIQERARAGLARASARRAIADERLDRSRTGETSV
jgi:DNA invertase Pin-like site-specific DNA recombinase